MKNLECVSELKLNSMRVGGEWQLLGQEVNQLLIMVPGRKETIVLEITPGGALEISSHQLNVLVDTALPAGRGGGVRLHFRHKKAKNGIVTANEVVRPERED